MRGMFKCESECVLDGTIDMIRAGTPRGSISTSMPALLIIGYRRHCSVVLGKKEAATQPYPVIRDKIRFDSVLHVSRRLGICPPCTPRAIT